MLKTAIDVATKPILAWAHLRPCLPTSVRPATGKPQILFEQLALEANGPAFVAARTAQDDQQDQEPAVLADQQASGNQAAGAQEGEVELLKEPLVSPSRDTDSSRIMHALGAAVRPLGTAWLPEELQGPHEVLKSPVSTLDRKLCADLLGTKTHLFESISML
jgi:hypothetical protein